MRLVFLKMSRNKPPTIFVDTRLPLRAVLGLQCNVYMATCQAECSSMSFNVVCKMVMHARLVINVFSCHIIKASLGIVSDSAHLSVITHNHLG